MEKRIPVVFIHEGKQYYLKRTIGLAGKYNDLVYLIGDKKNRSFSENWVFNQDLDIEKFREFSKNYKHMSTNPFQFELNCFKRFYLLRSFMLAKEMDSCVMLDSDLCTFVNYSDIGFEKYDVALSIKKKQEPYIWAASPHCSYWTIKALESFIEFFEDIYKNHIQILREKWQWHKEQGCNGGICDMTLLYLWVKENKWNCLNLAQMYEGKIFDDNVGVSFNYGGENFLMRVRYQIKKVEFIEQIPYFFEKNLKKKIPVNTIHAQGSNKRYISVLAKGYNTFWTYEIAKEWSSIKQKFRWILKKYK